MTVIFFAVSETTSSHHFRSSSSVRRKGIFWRGSDNICISLLTITRNTSTSKKPEEALLQIAHSPLATQLLPFLSVKNSSFIHTLWSCQNVVSFLLLNRPSALNRLSVLLCPAHNRHGNCRNIPCSTSRSNGTQDAIINATSLPLHGWPDSTSWRPNHSVHGT